MAGARHGMCELTARHDRGTAWARHAMRESALSLPFCSKWQDDRRREDEKNDRTLNVLRCAPAAGAEAPSVRSGRCRTKEI